MRGENHNLGAREVAGLHKKSKGEVGVRTEDEKKKKKKISIAYRGQRSLTREPFWEVGTRCFFVPRVRRLFGDLQQGGTRIRSTRQGGYLTDEKLLEAYWVQMQSQSPHGK